eukprot:7544-Heterococcus_DN1.PRE.1
METSDLSCAAPATVSRAGVLHISDQQQHSSSSSSHSSSCGNAIGDVNAQWRCLIAAWVQRQDAPEAHKLALAQLFEVYLPQLVQRLDSTTNSSSSSGCAAAVPLRATTAVITLLQLLEAFSQAPDHAELVREQLILEHTVVFCAVWAFGASLLTGSDGSSSSDPRKSFSDWWRSTFTRGAELPLSGSVFDYYLALDSDTLPGDPLRCRFELWTADLLQPVAYSSSSVHSAVMLQTGESTAVAYWARQRLLRGESVLVTGRAGTGKTQLITALIREARAAMKSVATTSIALNHYTTASTLRNTVAACLQRTSTTSYTPPDNKRSIILFIDDLHLPAELSSLELARQLIERGHWHQPISTAASAAAHTTASGCHFIASYTPHTAAAGTAVSARLCRHFAAFALDAPAAGTLVTLFETVVESHLRSNGFNAD